MIEIRLWIVRQQKSLHLYSDLAGPIQPLVKDGYKYILNFINDYTGLTMLYFLKHKSDTLLTTPKYLADIAPYGHVECLRTDNGMEFTPEPLQWLLVFNRIKHQLLILCIKMGLLNSHGELYFLQQGIFLLNQNCPKTYGLTH